MGNQNNRAAAKKAAEEEHQAQQDAQRKAKQEAEEAAKRKAKEEAEAKEMPEPQLEQNNANAIATAPAATALPSPTNAGVSDAGASPLRPPVLHEIIEGQLWVGNLAAVDVKDDRTAAVARLAERKITHVLVCCADAAATPLDGAFEGVEFKTVCVCVCVCV